LSVNTSRLLKAALPGACIWTSLRESEGFSFDETKQELNKMFGAESSDAMDEDSVIPKAITSMLGDCEAVEALGSMIWYIASSLRLSFLNMYAGTCDNSTSIGTSFP
jgi:DNA mismatch repair protein MSH6